jgi:hypothetical protein
VQSAKPSVPDTPKPTAHDPLDGFERWLDRRLPEPRGPLATALVFVVQLILGRASWVTGAFLIAFAAPFIAYTYRQVESMVLAGYYRAAANGHAEARIESFGVRVLPDQGDNVGPRVEPYVILAFEPGPGPTIRVRYLPQGAGLEPFHQWAIGPSLFSSPPAYPGDLRFRWIDPRTGAPGFEMQIAESDRAVLDRKTPWSELSYRDFALAELDRPLDLLLGEWLLPADPPLTVPVRFPRGQPVRVFAGDVLDALPPSGKHGWAELMGSSILLGVFGIPIWGWGTRLLGRPLPRRHRHFMIWVPLALLPFWGTRYLEVAERLAPGVGEFNPLAQKTASTRLLPGAEPAAALVGPRQRVDFTTSRFAEILARVNLARPSSPLASADAVWQELVQRFTNTTAALPDAELERVLSIATQDVFSPGETALAPVLVEAALRVSLDPARPEELRAQARQLLIYLLGEHWPPLCAPAFAAKRATIEPLGRHPHPEVAEAAAGFFTAERGFIEARQRDWGEVCP